VRESKGRQRRDASIPHFLKKMNYVLSPLLTEEREERGIKKTKKKKNDVAYLFVFWLIGLIILGPYFRGLKFLWKIILGLILKKKGP
jgi:hypothetical protein